VGKVKKFPAAGRGGIKASRLKELGLEEISDLIVDMGNALKDERRKKTAEDEDKN
jgi:hypothetical protein